MCLLCDGIDLRQEITVVASSISSMSVTLTFFQPDQSAPDVYTVSLTGISCSGLPTLTGSTTSNSISFDNLLPGTQYFVNVSAMYTILQAVNNKNTTVTTNEEGKLIICD